MYEQKTEWIAACLYGWTTGWLDGQLVVIGGLKDGWAASWMDVWIV